MPISEEAIARLISPLAEVRPITSRKMFGGLGIYCDGVFFAVLDNDRLYFKSDALTDGQFDEHKAEQWVIESEPPAPMPYRELPASIWSDPATLGEWIDAAVDVATRKKSKKPKES